MVSHPCHHEIPNSVEFQDIAWAKWCQKSYENWIRDAQNQGFQLVMGVPLSIAGWLGENPNLEMDDEQDTPMTQETPQLPGGKYLYLVSREKKKTWENLTENREGFLFLSRSTR